MLENCLICTINFFIYFKLFTFLPYKVLALGYILEGYFHIKIPFFIIAFYFMKVGQCSEDLNHRQPKLTSREKAND